MKLFSNKTCRHFSWLSFSLFLRSPLTLCQFLNAKKSRNRNTISFCQPKNFLTSRHLAGSFPRCQSGSGDASQSGSIILSQLRFPPEIMQPRSVGISPCFWFSSHAAARVICKIERISILSKFRQCLKLGVDGKLKRARIAADLDHERMKITANAKLSDFRSHIARKRCRPIQSAISQIPCHPPIFGDCKNRSAALFGRHQPLPRATKRQLDSKSCGQKEVDFSGFKFLQVARGNLGSFGQFFLCQPFANPLAADIRSENFDSLPFFFGNSHDILHRGSTKNVNDTYIVKTLSDFACQDREFAGQWKKISTGRRFF